MVRRICLKVVRWSGWLLLPLVLAFFASGYAMTGRYGFEVLANEQAALAVHRALHAPVLALLVAQVVPSVYLAALRNGWFNFLRRGA